MRLPVFIVIAWCINVAWAKRYPADLIHVVKRYERNESWRVLRRGVYASWNPVPLITYVGPTTIVIRRITPRLTRNPGWTIGVIVNPISLLIGNPTRINSRPPGITITVDGLPITVIIQVINARDN